jgi:prefoldin alpha subunit
MSTSASQQQAPLSTAQIIGLKAQLEQEIEIFKGSFSQLKVAYSKFQSSLTSVQTLQNGKASGDAKAMLPITNSLFLKGKVKDSCQNVLVDIGTGYLMQKSLPEAAKYFECKVEYVAGQLVKLNDLLVEKTNSLNTLNAFLQQQQPRSQ